ncbi:ACP phosphodiesterase [Pontibacter silvestris]|uniref:ACP phosphodiesterase n=1 Tax=Pontibacter silvestris TaxID=2305183 RepID=A0ABW4X0C8_9BACT|nr:ACP phosphodiesterase [Pontibacter silvestris]MCC9138262.1 ACP phosphodiesterase [Pontibacter silvestris]
MNFLAHLFLSGDDEELLLGNFIADSVKGKQSEIYAPGIAKGIKLHRLIDTYTDTHPIVAMSKARLRTKYKKFAPVIADIFYDHFLAKQFEHYAPLPLAEYADGVYRLIHNHFLLLPPKVQHFFPYMMRQNWLVSYAELEGIGQTLTGLSRRATFESGMETAVEELQENYALYAADFAAFFPELITYVEEVKPYL